MSEERTALPSIERRHGITLTAPNGQLGVGEVELALRSSGERWRPALVRWGAAWLGAVAAVFIPVIHFVLVPTLVLAGPLVAILSLGGRQRVVSGRGTCPRCQADVTLEPGPVRWPRDEDCASCGARLEVALSR